MPITLDPSLPSSLYPLAWLIGSWEGTGALHVTDGSGDRRVEQRLDCVAQEDGTLAWRSLIHVVDDPAPLPPTSAFARDDAPGRPAGSGERSVLMRETGIWTVGDPLPGQDLAAAESAAPGDRSAIISFALSAEFERDGETTAWDGEARGPRIQLAQRVDAPSADGPAIAATRMLGYVGGRLMWLWEIAGADHPDRPDQQERIPYVSVELDRA